MLIEFRFKNFASFRDEQVLSMVASSYKTLAEENTISVPSLGKRRLVRSAVVYGANASGKSNLVAALEFVKVFVQMSADQKPGTEIPLNPFLLDKTSAASRSEFEVTFIHNAVRYQYGFSADHRRVYEEWLIAYPKGFARKWFERSPDPDTDESEWYFGPHLKGEKEKLVLLTRPDVLFLSVAAKFNHKQLSEAYNWFANHLRVIGVGNVVDLDCFLFTANLTVSDKDFNRRIASLLRDADFGIEDFSVQERKALPEDMPEELRRLISRYGAEWAGKFEVQLQHRTEGRPAVRFPLELESDGTQRVFRVGGPWIYTLQHGFTLVVDELDASLHPHLVRGLVSMFHNPDLNSRNAQLIFNTHDTTLLDSSLFRRDQIWFTEKDNSGASHLYPLLDYRPRKDEALEKWYMRGKYGAIPIIGGLDLLGGDTSDGKA